VLRGFSLPIRSLRIWAKAASRSVVVGGVVVVMIAGDGEYNSVFSSSDSYVAVPVPGATRPRRPELAVELALRYCLGPLLSCLRAEGSGSSKSLRMLRMCGGGHSTCEAGDEFQERGSHNVRQCCCSAVLPPTVVLPCQYRPEG